jgi:hypothetical protein
MSDRPQELTGVLLSPQEYVDDFFPRFWNIEAENFWKLERMQTFQEGNSASWEAFHQGDWDEALRLIQVRKGRLEEYYGRVRRTGFRTHRVRIVEEPISPYLHWQLHSLLQRNELGERTRIVSGEAVAKFEKNGPLPEIVTIGTSAVYQVLYDSDGANTGAIRSDSPEDLVQWRSFIKDLHAAGEEITSFFGRTVAQWEPPRVR